MPVYASNTFERKLVLYQYLLILVISYLSLKGHRKVVCLLIILHGHQVDIAVLAETYARTMW